MDFTAILSDPKFWVGMSLLLFFVAFGKKLFTAAIRALDARSQRIAAELNEACTLREEAEALLAQYRQRYQDSIKEAESILAEARRRADDMAAAAEAELQALITARTRMAHDKIAQAEAEAIKEVRNHVVDITIAAAKSLVVEHLEDTPPEEIAVRALADMVRKVH